MIYPAYLCPGDDQRAYGVTLPDFEGCFSAADDYGKILTNLREALELYFDAQPFDFPVSSDLALLDASGLYCDGVWVFVDIEFDVAAVVVRWAGTV